MRHYVDLLRATLTVLLTLIAVAGTAFAGAWEDGTAAVFRGDYVTAYRLLRPLADRGDANAQNTIGFLYRIGEGGYGRITQKP
jgi:uncharacterized protein